MAVSNINRSKNIPMPELNQIIKLVDGVLYWQVKRQMGRISVGAVAGSITKTGYIEVCIGKKRYYAHRIAWALTHGEWPKSIIDHIDGDKRNNRPENLRQVTDAENNFNLKMRNDNTSGVKGVSSHCGGWHAEISCRGTRHRKWFKQLSDAKFWVEDLRKTLHKFGEIK